MIAPEKLKEIEGFAELQFTRAQIAVLMDDDDIAEVLLADPDEVQKKKLKLSKEDAAAILKAVVKGHLKAEAEVRKSIKTQAVQGATNAQKLMLDLVYERRQSEIEME